MLEQAWQLAGAILLLAGYVAAQLGWLGSTSMPYLMLNVAGSGILAVLAWLGRDWGFLLLEGVWGLVAAGTMLRKAGARRGSRTTQD